MRPFICGSPDHCSIPDADVQNFRDQLLTQNTPWITACADGRQQREQRYYPGLRWPTQIHPRSCSISR